MMKPGSGRLLAILFVLYGGAVEAQAREPEVTGGPVPPPGFSWQGLYDSVHVLAVGIDEYESLAIPKLRFATGDARAFAELMERHYGYTVTLLLGEQATKEAIEQAVADFARLGSKDVAIIYLAGHGVSVRSVERNGFQGYYLPYDARVSLDDSDTVASYKESTISMKDLGDRLRGLPAFHALCLADCCFAGYLGERDPGSPPRLGGRLKRRSCQVLSSGTHQQKSFEVEELGHGVFTSAVLEVLKGSRPTPVCDLARLTYKGVQERLLQARRRNPDERPPGNLDPQLRSLGGDGGEFVFVPTAAKDRGTDAPRIEKDLRLLDEAAARISDLFQVALAMPYSQAQLPLKLQREWEEKVKSHQASSRLGDPLAAACLYYCHVKGLGTKADGAQAFRWALEAYDSGSPAGLHVLADAYRRGAGVETNLQAAEQLESDAATRGFPISQSLIGESLLGRAAPDAETVTRAESLLRSAHGAGFIRAGTVLGVLYLRGAPGRPADPATGLPLLIAAAEAGDPRARLEVFNAWKVGAWPGDGHAGKARQGLREAAEAGLAEAQATLAGCLYQMRGYQALGFTAASEEALKWATAASRQGSAEADYILALMYRNGDGVVRNPDLTKQHLEAAVERNHLEAVFLSGQLLYKGEIYAKDDQAAFRCWLRAAERDHVQACWNVAFTHMDGWHKPFKGSRTNNNAFLEMGLKRTWQSHRLQDALPWYEKSARLGIMEVFSVFQDLRWREFDYDHEVLDIGRTAYELLHTAAMSGSATDVDDEGRSRLAWAIIIGDLEAFQRLMADRRALTLADEKGVLPIHFAAEKRDPALVTTLIAAGADVRVRTKNGATPLHFAAGAGTLDVIDTLIASGADVSDADTQGDTPLHVAVERGQDGSCERLLSHEARVLLENGAGTTPIDLLVERMDPKRLELLLRARRKEEGQKKPLRGGLLLTALRSGYRDSAQLIVREGVDLKAADDKGNGPLHLAAAAGDLQLVRLLIEKGADPFLENSAKQKPIDRARRDAAEIQEALRQAMAAIVPPR